MMLPSFCVAKLLSIGAKMKALSNNEERRGIFLKSESVSGWLGRKSGCNSTEWQCLGMCDIHDTAVGEICG